MKTLPLRLEPGADVRIALEAVLVAEHCSAGFVLSGIGSLRVAALRFASADRPSLHEGDLEILTLGGSLSLDGAHLHMSVADAQGAVWGGHVAEGCIVRTTAEVLIALLPGWRFTREADPAIGYRELRVQRR